MHTTDLKYYIVLEGELKLLVLKGKVHPRMKNAVVIYSPSCRWRVG